MNDNITVPNFLLSVDEENPKEGVYETSYVEYPATGLDFLAFNDTQSTTELKTLQFANRGTDFQRITSGVWMAPNTKYPKRTANGDFYTVEFKKEDLHKALMKYLKRGNADSVKVEHTGAYLDGFSALEHWIIEDANTKSPVLGLTLSEMGYAPNEIPVGTIMKSTYVADEKFWNEEIMTGKVKGYSIGGLFAFEPDASLFAKTEWNHKALFTAMGLNQDGGEVLLEDNTILELKDKVRVSGTDVNEGTFSTLNGWTIVVRQGEVVDYTFNDVPADVPVAEVVIEVAAEVAQEVTTDTVQVETEAQVQPEVVAETQQQAPQIETNESKIEALIAKMKEIEDKLTLVNAESALKDETIANLKEQADETSTKLKKANDELGKQPIKKPATVQTVSNDAKVGKTMKVGNKTVTVQARTHQH